MVTVANGFTNHPFYGAKSFLEDIWRLRLYPVLRTRNKLFSLCQQATRIRPITKLMELLLLQSVE